MKDASYFQVEEITPNSVVVGRNAYVDIPVGAVFTSLRRSKVIGHAENTETVDLGELARISLQLDKVEWFRQFINAVPRGHSAGLHLSGYGLESLAMALAGRQDREYVSLHLSA